MIGKVHRLEDQWSDAIDSSDTLLTLPIYLFSKPTKQKEPFKLKLKIDSALNTNNTDNADEEKMKLKITSKIFTFSISESTFNALNIDTTKCASYKKTNTTVKICLRMMQTIEAMSEYANQISALLDYIENGTQIQFDPKSQFSFAFLCDLFQVSF